MIESRLRVAIAVVAVLGIGVAGYLTYVHYSGTTPQCVVGHGCEKVQASHWSKLAGIPVAVLGLASYVALFATALWRGEVARMAGACIALAGFGFSVWLTYLEVARIHAICPWCVTSAVLMSALAVLTVGRAVTGESQRSPGPSPAAPRRADG